MPEVCDGIRARLFLLADPAYRAFQQPLIPTVPPERVIVLFDDISLPVGRLRVRADGSAGGHNGIKSIIGCLNSQSFPRVKIGVGQKPHPDYDLADWVLSNFTKDEDAHIERAVGAAAEAALTVIAQGVPDAAAKFNGAQL